ncbi:hypothetical protein FA95DRAFT_985255 [Auriscalpium vulgare]|uniref:Uncharacterized protein n=1 Tax=Auriscalpium vulgare TaxID=40419 RepID=A0ACB8RXD1_9AGAM|nr:hypothetical protein FA95DRAFT_985255 [Auriscalpium vulgare]
MSRASAQPKQDAVPDPSSTPALEYDPVRLARVHSYRPTTAMPRLHRVKGTPFRVFGFALTDAWLDDYCRAHDLGPLDTLGRQSNAHLRAITKVLDEAGVSGRTALKPVYTGEVRPSDPRWPDYAMCLVIGNNKTEERRRPPPEVITRLQAVLGSDATPMWYKLA